jgi:hypothetical protein
MELIIINIMSAVACYCAIIGSKQFTPKVDKPLLGAKYFVVGNSINIIIGLSLGNIPFIFCQYMLRHFTVHLTQDDKKFMRLTYAMMIALLAVIGITNKELIISMPIIDSIGSALAILGAIALKRNKGTLMCWCWLVADIIFLYIGITNKLVGLSIASCFFIYHSILRLRGVK